MEDTPVVNLKTPEGRVSFPSVFEPSEYGDTPKYELTLIFPKGENLSEFKQAARDAATEKWGKDIPKGLKNPFKKVANKLDTYGEEFDPECEFIVFRSTNRPGVVDAAVKPIIDQSEFYAGCWALVSTNAFAWEFRNKKTNAVMSRGVSFGLNNIQKVRDDDPLAGNRVKAEDDFEPVAGSSGDPGAYDEDGDIFGKGSDEDITEKEEDPPF